MEYVEVVRILVQQDQHDDTGHRDMEGTPIGHVTVRMDDPMQVVLCIMDVFHMLDRAVLNM